MAKTILLEDRIKKAIKAHEKQNKELVTSLKVTIDRPVGFNRKENVIVNYWTK